MEVGEEFEVDEVSEVVAGHGGIVIELAVLALGGGPGVPAEGFVKDEAVFFAFQLGLCGFVLLQAIQVFQEQQPGGLLGVVQLGRAPGLCPQHVVDVFKRLFKYRDLFVYVWLWV